MTVVQSPWYVECTNTKQGLLWAATISAELNDSAITKLPKSCQSFYF